MTCEKALRSQKAIARKCESGDSELLEICQSYQEELHTGTESNMKEMYVAGSKARGVEHLNPYTLERV